jgi:alpha-tubulin suppressor-like RCC1 family protein
LSTEADFEGEPFADKTRTCVTNHVGELRCGIWQFATTNPLMPVLPAADPRFFTQVDVGQNHTCAIDNQFDVYCFGSNAFGQFGMGTFDSGISLKPGVAANR